AVGTLLGLWQGRAQLAFTERAVLALGLIVSAVISYLVLPEVPEDVDVLLALSFAGAWVPAALASAYVLWRKGVRSASVFNSTFAWVLGGAFALPAAETIGVLVP